MSERIGVSSAVRAGWDAIAGPSRDWVVRGQGPASRPGGVRRGLRVRLPGVPFTDGEKRTGTLRAD